MYEYTEVAIADVRIYSCTMTEKDIPLTIKGFAVTCSGFRYQAGTFQRAISRNSARHAQVDVSLGLGLRTM